MYVFCEYPLFIAVVDIQANKVHMVDKMQTLQIAYRMLGRKIFNTGTSENNSNSLKGVSDYITHSLSISEAENRAHARGQVNTAKHDVSIFFIHPLLPSDKTRTTQFLDFTSCNLRYSRYFDDIEHSHVFGPCFVAHSSSINSSHCQAHLEQEDNCLREFWHFASVIRLHCVCPSSNRPYKMINQHIFEGILPCWNLFATDVLFPNCKWEKSNLL